MPHATVRTHAQGKVNDAAGFIRDEGSRTQRIAPPGAAVNAHICHGDIKSSRIGVLARA